MLYVSPSIADVVAPMINPLVCNIVGRIEGKFVLGLCVVYVIFHSCVLFSI
jgi:hypothetical protein